MYSKAKSNVKTTQGLSSCFYCNVGLRQGENLVLILFSFLNNLKSFLGQNVNGFNISRTLAQKTDVHDIVNYVYLFLLLYADDTIVLAETSEDMQEALDTLNAIAINMVFMSMQKKLSLLM